MQTTLKWLFRRQNFPKQTKNYSLGTKSLPKANERNIWKSQQNKTTLSTMNLCRGFNDHLHNRMWSLFHLHYPFITVFAHRTKLSEIFSDFWQSDHYNFISSAMFPFCCALWYNEDSAACHCLDLRVSHPCSLCSCAEPHCLVVFTSIIWFYL